MYNIYSSTKYIKILYNEDPFIQDSSQHIFCPRKAVWLPGTVSKVSAEAFVVTAELPTKLEVRPEATQQRMRKKLQHASAHLLVQRVCFSIFECPNQERTQNAYDLCQLRMPSLL